MDSPNQGESTTVTVPPHIATSPNHVEPPEYKKTPTPPATGAIIGASVVIDECHRPDIYHIICIGELTNTTDAPEQIFLGDSTVVDDEGNSFFINGGFEGAGGFTLGEIANGSGGGGGAFEPFMPGVATKFSTHIKDGHQNVRSVSLMLGFNLEDGGHSRLTFPRIAVQ
jgi:hypothetical protein